jgi:subtilisin-like proprotein convertase family protein
MKSLDPKLSNKRFRSNTTAAVKVSLAIIGLALLSTTLVMRFVAAESVVYSGNSADASTAHRPSQQFCNSSPITIPGSGSANPYPSIISVSGISGVVSEISITLNGLQHEFAGDVDILLVGPGGQKFIVLSDTAGSLGFIQPRTLTLSDSGPDLVPQAQGLLPDGTYKPTNRGSTADTFSGVTGPYQSPATFGTETFGSVFGFADPNGDWKLYVVDDSSFDGGGSIAGGWCLDITTVAASPGQLQFDSDSYSQDEQAGAKTITVTRTDGVSGEVTVDYATSGGTAVGGSSCASGVDYINTAGTLTFASGETSRSFDVTVCNDSELDPGETIGLALSNPGGGATLGTPATAVLTITRLDSVCSTTPISLEPFGATSPYPSTISIAGFPGTIDDLSVTLNNIQHPDGYRLNMLLVSPGGRKFIILGQAGGLTVFDNAVTFSLADAGQTILGSPPVPNGVYKPTNQDPMFESLPAPAPGIPYEVPGPRGIETFASAFRGVPVNGDWSLYVDDPHGPTTGSISGGWCLGFTSKPASPGELQFVSSSSSVFESDQSLDIETRRVNGATGAVGVSFAITGGTATGGTS